MWYCWVYQCSKIFLCFQVIIEYFSWDIYELNENDVLSIDIDAGAFLYLEELESRNILFWKIFQVWSLLKLFDEYVVLINIIKQVFSIKVLLKSEYHLTDLVLTQL